jgi:sulfhydrogenase subunit gamma (sulfur reductase)
METQTATATHIPINYMPYKMRIDAITDETIDVKTFRLVFDDEAEGEQFSFKGGQFGLYSAFGYGESTFCISSPPTRKGYIECSVKKAGKVTAQLHALNEGDVMGFRGPYGNSFPVEEMKGKNLIFVGGGIGLAPVRSLILECFDRRDEFADILIVYGARSVGDLVFKQELHEWEKRDDVRTVFTVDPGGETEDWTGQIGFVPTVLKEQGPSPENAVVVMCGPPIMIKFSLQPLVELGFSMDQVVTTLENRMKCGVGKCGRCNIGNQYVCKDGPVFTCAQIQNLPDEF